MLLVQYSCLKLFSRSRGLCQKDSRYILPESQVSKRESTTHFCKSQRHDQGCYSKSQGGLSHKTGIYLDQYDLRSVWSPFLYFHLFSYMKPVWKIILDYSDFFKSSYMYKHNCLIKSLIRPGYSWTLFMDTCYLKPQLSWIPCYLEMKLFPLDGISQ